MPPILVCKGIKHVGKRNEISFAQNTMIIFFFLNFLAKLTLIYQYCKMLRREKKKSKIKTKEAKEKSHYSYTLQRV